MAHYTNTFSIQPLSKKAILKIRNYGDKSQTATYTINHYVMYIALHTGALEGPHDWSGQT